MKISDALRNAANRLSSVCERPRLEAELLLSHHLGCERSRLLLKYDEELKNDDLFENILQRREKNEPLEYIVGKVSFYDFELYIAPGALIPRPETEILVEKAAELIKNNNVKHIAEIGVGSGAVSIALARIFSHIKIEASDISAEALKIAKKNIDAFNLGGQITLHHTSLLDTIGSVDMVVSNPPYIAEGTALDANIVEYEPHTALFAPENGDYILQEILVLCKKRGIGLIACEMGYDQKERISEYSKKIGMESLAFYKDLAGHDRGFTYIAKSGLNKPTNKD